MPTPENHIPELPALSPAQTEPPPQPIEDPPWNLWDVIALAFISFFTVLGCVLALGYFVHRRFTPAAPFFESLKLPEVIVGGQLLAYVLVFLLMYRMVYNQSHGHVLSATRWNWPERWLPYVLGGIALEICLVPFEYLLPMPKHAPIEDFFRTARDAWILSAFGVLFAPLFEELLFRGFLYPALARRLGMVPSIGVTALAFASIHASQLKYSWGPVLVIFLVGVTLTTVRAVKKSVAATVLMHMAYNGTIFLGAYIATDGFRHMEKFNQ